MWPFKGSSKKSDTAEAVSEEVTKVIEEEKPVVNIFDIKVELTDGEERMVKGTNYYWNQDLLKIYREDHPAAYVFMVQSALVKCISIGVKESVDTVK